MKSKKQQKHKPVELFDSIKDMWQYNWERLNTAPFDPKWMIKSDRERDNKPNISKQRYEKAYFNLHDQYSERTGASEKIDEWKTLIIMRMEARLKMVKPPGDPKQINFINNYDHMIKDLMQQGSGETDMVKSRMAYSQAFGGIPIDAKSISVEEYIGITEVVQDQQAAARTPNN